MGFIASISMLYCLVVFLSSVQSIRRPFWRRPKPTLPSLTVNPQYYQKLQVIPAKNETVKKVITNILRIRPGGIGKRQITFEDSIIVMDGSGSIGSCEFNKGRKAMKNLVGFMQSAVDAQYAMVTFADDVRRDFGFLPQSQAKYKMDSVNFPDGVTNTQAGLAEALNLFNTGGRGFKSRKVILLLTDGQSNVQPQNTLPNAQKLKNGGVEIFVVAVGSLSLQGINEMAHIASDPPKDNMFRVQKVGDFLEIVQLAIKEVAPGKYALLDGVNDPPCSTSG